MSAFFFVLFVFPPAAAEAMAVGAGERVKQIKQRAEAEAIYEEDYIFKITEKKLFQLPNLTGGHTRVYYRKIQKSAVAAAIKDIRQQTDKAVNSRGGGILIQARLNSKGKKFLFRLD